MPLPALAHQGGDHSATHAGSAAATELTGRIETVTVIDRAAGTSAAYSMLAIANGARYRLENIGAGNAGTLVTVTGRVSAHTLVADRVRGAQAQPAAVTPKASVRGQRTGTIRVFHVDYPDGTSEFGYDLRDGTGRGNVIDLGTPLPGVENGARATVSGPIDARGYISVDTIEILSSPMPATNAPMAKATAAAVTTSFATAPLNTPTNGAAPWSYNADPFTIASITSSVYGAAPTKSTAEYYKEVSFGAQLISGSVLNASGAWLKATAARPGSCGTSAELDNWLSYIESQAELQAASATPPISGLNWSSYPNGILYIANSLPCGWSGLGYIGFERSYTNGTASLGVVGHEFGHNFGLYHAGSLDCGANVIAASGCSVTEYGDPFVIMGNIQSGHFNAHQKNILGYIPGGFVTHSSGTVTYDLGPIESPSQTLYGIAIPTSKSNRTYLIEFRQAIGFDASVPGISALGAQVRVAYPFENQCSGCSGKNDDTQILDMTPGTASFTDAALLVGQTYTDTTVTPNVSIQVMSGSATKLTVKVSTGGTTSTTTTLASSANPSTQGQNVTITASVTGNAPTGNVAFKDGGNNISGCTAVALTGSGNTRTAACTTGSLAIGAHSITADYAGDVNNSASSSSPLSQAVKAASTTTLVALPNPSTSGANVTFTATVAGSAPTGSVGFTSDGANIAGCTAIALSGSGNSRTAACTTSALAVGAHSIVANYGGDSNNGTSSSAPLSQTVNGAGPASTTTSLASNVNPSTSGSSVTFTATVNGSTPTGNVGFTSDGAGIAGCAAIALAGGGNSRTAACTTSALTPGTHAIVASYAGNGGNQASASPPLSQIVSAPNVAATTTTVTSAANPSPPGQLLALTATVVASPPVASGTVAFTANGAPISGCSGLPVVPSGNARVATCSTTLQSGAYSIVATYGGEAASLPSTSMVFSQVVPFAATGNTIQIPTSAYSVNESAGAVQVMVTRTGDVSAGAYVDYATVAGTATASGDFTAASGTLNWAPGDSTPRIITVPIANDGTAESNETFTVNLLPPNGAALGASAGTTVTILDDESAPTAMPGQATVVQNPYGTMSVQGGTLNGNIISNLQKSAVIQLGANAGGAGSFAQIDFQGLQIGAGNTLTIRSGAAGQTVVLTNTNGATVVVAGLLQAQGGGAAAPNLVVKCGCGITIDAGGVVSAPGGLTLDALDPGHASGNNIVNQGTVNGGASLMLFASTLNGWGSFLGDATTISVLGNANNPIQGAHYLANGLHLFPSTGNSVAATLSAYGPAKQVINLIVHGNATFAMPSAWPNGSPLPPNNRPVMPSEVRAAGVPDPAYGAGSMIVQATGNLTLNGGVSQDLVFPGGVVLKAAGTLDVHGTAIDNGWTTSGASFQGVFLEAASIVDTLGANGISVRTNDLNWVNFSVRPTVPVKTWTLQRQGDGTAKFVAADATAPHLNFFGVVSETGAAGNCWTCLFNPQAIDFSTAP
ncbi:MAG: Ig-like domain repeat protein [Burkholderiales bacterium]